MKGDWVQAQYFINPSEWTTHAQSVAPLRYSRLNQVIFIVFPIETLDNIELTTFTYFGYCILCIFNQMNEISICRNVSISSQITYSSLTMIVYL